MCDSAELGAACRRLTVSNQSLSEVVADFVAEASSLASMNGNGNGIRRRILDKLKLAKGKSKDKDNVDGR
jgi:flagellar motor switch protein FliG